MGNYVFVPEFTVRTLNPRLFMSFVSISHFGRHSACQVLFPFDLYKFATRKRLFRIDTPRQETLQVFG